MKKNIEVIKKLFKFMKSYRKKYLIVLILSIFAASFAVAGPYILSFLIDNIYNSFTNNLRVDYNYIIIIIIILLLCYILESIFAYYKSYISAKIGNQFTYELRKKLINKINSINLLTLDTRKKGDTISRITNDTGVISNLFSEVIPELFYNSILIVGTIIMMFVVSFKLTLICILIIPVTIFALATVMSKTQKYFKKNQEKIGSVNALVEESITNNIIIKSFNKEDYFYNKFDKENKELMQYNYKSGFYSHLFIPFTKFLSNINYVIIVGLGATMVIKGKLRIGAIQAFIQYMKDFNRPMNVLSQVIGEVQTTIAASDRVFEFLDIKNESNGKLTSYKFNKNIEFKDVNFNYIENTDIIKNLNLTIKKGEKIAIVGKTGSGKTTLVNLLLNFYELNKGSILVDGLNINEIDREVYRQKIGMVLQDTWLFEGTIKENIIFEDNISDKELDIILKKSKLNHIINSIPEGLNHKINDNADNLSEGEKQLITIARALAKNPEILILDEATSNVDSRLEYLINLSMKNLMKKRTSLVIAHRLSTIVDSDRIIVVDDGQIVEEGTHKQLLSKKGYYYNLYNSQFSD